MVLRQCLACNSMMTESCRSCQCGHVFEDTKQIAGRRFSEYRVELYTRLENRREKQLTKQTRKAIKQESVPQPLKEHKNNTEELAIAPPRFSNHKNHSLSSKLPHRKIKSKRIRRSAVKPSPRSTVVPSGLVSRLPSALQEINRRLIGQNMMWWMLQLQ
ncbi:uncharacterized protein [Porites lutea]|uniref:uncharacterized protein n=1 Tax=Porites lutea TaxID=51062 RepID=UPI003CC5CAA6